MLRKLLAIYEAARDFIISVNDEHNYEEYREEILRRFNRAREKNHLVIEEHEDIHEYLRNLSSAEAKLASVYRRLGRDKSNEDLIREKNKLCEWFKQQGDQIEENFKDHIFQS